MTTNSHLTLGPLDPPSDPDYVALARALPEGALIISVDTEGIPYDVLLRTAVGGWISTGRGAVVGGRYLAWEEARRWVKTSQGYGHTFLVVKP